MRTWDLVLFGMGGSYISSLKQGIPDLGGYEVKPSILSSATMFTFRTTTPDPLVDQRLDSALKVPAPAFALKLVLFKVDEIGLTKYGF